MLTTPEIDNPDALSKYYKLLLSVVRVITSIVLSRGSQNEQTIDQARSFLIENRATIVAIFKRQAKIGARLPVDTSASVNELVELFTLLITMTGFLEVGLRDQTEFLRLIYCEVRRKTGYKRVSKNCLYLRLRWIFGKTTRIAPDVSSAFSIPFQKPSLQQMASM